MTSPHPLKFYLHNEYHPDYSHFVDEIRVNYCAIVKELVKASSHWQTAGFHFSLKNASDLEDAPDFEAALAACLCHSSYPVLKELCLDFLPMSQFLSQERVPALRVLEIHDCQIELHAVQSILLQITDLDLRYPENDDVDFHAILSYAPALSQLTVYLYEFKLETYMSRIQSDARSPVLLSHLHRLHVDSSTFILDIITAPNLVHLHVQDDSLHSDNVVALRSNMVDAFMRRSRCNIESLHLDFDFRGSNWSSSITITENVRHPPGLTSGSPGSLALTRPTCRVVPGEPSLSLNFERQLGQPGIVSTS
ncbi:hypothetical protein FISHEDRAFT_68652 [Fistulina hepatica ATCC 64428]|uniref:Uncharacterized protein n=1 Tax=Fistulina hepatica ATCC 64428 TaxID=1128425 RepID=A0A0D7APF3_9AGAR|nr:hypothetical protein FISHEDRAFT_68652 [Fistulina hepatica ATCC 64428]